MQEVTERTGGKIRLWPATLYGAIKRMLAAGLIEEESTRPDPASDDKRRKYYRLAERGRQVLASETARLAQIVEMARAKDVLDSTGPV